VTTNAIDLQRGIIASDSRWSFLKGDYFYFIDDTAFDKIVEREISAMIFAGFGPLIDQWRTWFLTPTWDLVNMPPTNMEVDGVTESVELCGIYKHSAEVFLRTRNHDPFPPGSASAPAALFTGTGAPYAITCFGQNGCSKKAVETAMALDLGSGGTVKYLELKTGNTNLGPNNFRLDHVGEEFEKRGSVMNVKTQKISGFAEFKNTGAANAATLKGSDVMLSAPTGRPPHIYTDEEREELREALRKVAEFENAQKK
jgi:hypothetical protein